MGRTVARCGGEGGFILASWWMMLPAKQRDFGVAWLISIVSIGEPVRFFSRFFEGKIILIRRINDCQWGVTLP
jgi:hypothetical protein